MKNKEQRRCEAEAHVADQQKRHKPLIKLSVEHSYIYVLHDTFNKKTEFDNSEIKVVDMDAVSAIASEYLNEDRSQLGVLSFASYKYAGGGYINGSLAQEECLCAESNLYNILSDKRFERYYSSNRNNANGGLYSSIGIMSPDVLFRNKYEATVFTCAAPNKREAERRNNLPEAENTVALRERIGFVLSCFNDYGCDVLILGAYGCGVFGQDPDEVAQIFKEYLENDFKGCFRRVVFAIPKSGLNTNYEAFEQVFCDRT